MYWAAGATNEQSSFGLGFSGWSLIRIMSLGCLGGKQMTRLNSFSIISLVALLLGGCAGGADVGAGSPSTRTVADIEGYVDSASGTVHISRVMIDESAVAGRAAYLDSIVEDRNGTRGDVDMEDTIELPTMFATDSDPDGVAYADPAVCDTDFYCATVRMDSFFRGAYLRNAHVEIYSMSPYTGFRAVDDISSGYFGLNGSMGLWNYGTLEPWNGSGSAAGFGRNTLSSAARPWRFPCPSGSCSFSFKGRIWADIEGTSSSLPPVAASLLDSGNTGGNVTGQTVSRDGRYVAFSTSAAFESSDTNGLEDIYLFDRYHGDVTLITSGANGASRSPEISADGSVVVFETAATNLPGLTDGNGTASDIVLWTRATGVFELVSVSTGGAAGDRASFRPSVSSDGTYVVFDSQSRTLAPVRFGSLDVFLRDRSGGGTTTVVSLNRDGVSAGGWSRAASVSDDGRWVAFISSASDFTTTTDTGGWDVYLADLSTGDTIRVSEHADGSQPDYGDVYMAPRVSALGEFVVFSSRATNLVDGDTNGVEDVFLYDVAMDVLTRATNSGVQGADHSETPDVDGSGRVIFVSASSNWDNTDTNGVDDVFVYDKTSNAISRLSVAPDGSQLNNSATQPRIARGSSYYSYRGAGPVIEGPGTNALTAIVAQLP